MENRFVVARTIIILTLVFAAHGISGCKPPESKQFADGVRTKKLHPEAAAEVRDVVNEHFGTPHHLVATLELPIKFGRIPGKVIATPAGVELKPHQCFITLNEGTYSKGDLKGLGVVWKSGDYQEATYTIEKNDSKAGLKKGDEVIANFHVLSFHPYKPENESGKLEPAEEASNQGILSLNFKLAEPLKPGDSFEIVGNYLRTGRKLYMQHCMHCHGYSGDGNGPTAKYLNPLPRDYRLGIFKFTSTKRPDKATRDDLMTILVNGIPGTYMPSFKLQPRKELEAIIEYIRWLAIRGEFEKILGDGMEFTKENWDELKSQKTASYEKALERWKKRPGRKPEPQLEDFDPSSLLKEYVEAELPAQTETALTVLKKNWNAVELKESKPKRIVRPLSRRVPPTPESIARGRALYLSNTTNCWTCHGKTGEGNGPQTTAFQKNIKEGGEYPEPGLYDDWGNKIKPRNLTRGIFRGGRRPIDLYRRIKVGIKGTPMPSFGTLTDQQIWDIVNYVLHVPVEQKHAGVSPKTSAGKMAAKD
ncbi:MAG: hypothetical protein Tsb009_28070 [Planctomycetaceae bacterium]